MGSLLFDELAKKWQQNKVVDIVKQNTEQYAQPDTNTNRVKQYVDAGISPEIADELSRYQPGTPVVDILTKNRQQPVAPDPKKQQNAMRVAALAQGLGILGDAFAASQGAFVNRRSDNPVGQVAATQKELRQLYEEKLDRYNQAMIQALMQDAQAAEQWKQNQINMKLADMKQKEQRAYNEKEFDRQLDEQIKKSKATSDINAEKEIYVAKEKDKLNPDEPKKEVIPPEQVVEINKAFAALPIDYLKKLGYTTKVKVKQPKTPGSYTIVEVEKDVPKTDISPEIMRAIIRRHDKEFGAPPAQTTTGTPAPAGVMPGLTKTKAIWLP